MSAARRAIARDTAWLACVVFAACARATAAHAQWRGADAESTLARPDTVAATARGDTVAATPLDRYLGGLADSTARRFGGIAAPVDTGGFAHILANADWDSLGRVRRHGHLGWTPWWRFDRTTGHVPGAGVTFGETHRGGQLVGSLGYAFSSEEWYGRGELRRGWGPRVGGTRWLARAGAGRAIETMDPDRGPTFLSSFWAALEGADWQSYLRLDGASASVVRENATLRLRFGVRSELESPRATATDWNLLGHPLEHEANTQALLRRVRELSGMATWRLPWPSWWTELEVRQGAHVAHGDPIYTRTRAALAAKLGLGHRATLVPQATYGRLEGDLSPQDAFWLGGSSSLRSLPFESESGQRKAFGRLELFGAPDVLTLAGLPHPPALDLYLAAQVASGAVWGEDPYGGPPRGGHAWPDRSLWRSEAGFSLMYRPGMPMPDGFVRFDWAHGIGADPDRSRWSMQFALPFDQLVPLGP